MSLSKKFEYLILAYFEIGSISEDSIDQWKKQ